MLRESLQKLPLQRNWFSGRRFCPINTSNVDKFTHFFRHINDTQIRHQAGGGLFVLHTDIKLFHNDIFDKSGTIRISGLCWVEALVVMSAFRNLSLM